MAQTFDTIDVFRELHMHGGKMTNVHGIQAAAIEDAAAVSDVPTMGEFNDLVGKLNALLAAARGVGMIARS